MIKLKVHAKISHRKSKSGSSVYKSDNGMVAFGNPMDHVGKNERKRQRSAEDRAHQRHTSDVNIDGRKGFHFKHGSV